jgi:hypothetical protein
MYFLVSFFNLISFGLKKVTYWPEKRCRCNIDKKKDEYRQKSVIDYLAIASEIESSSSSITLNSPFAFSGVGVS